MKNVLFQTTALVLSIFLLFGCEKDKITAEEPRSNLVYDSENILELDVEANPGIHIITSEKHGNYLSFKSMDHVRSVVQGLIKYVDEDELDKWSSQFNYQSALNTDILYSMPPHIMVLLNSQGYLEVDGKVQYTDFENGKVYEEEGGKKKLLYEPNEPQFLNRSSCDYFGETGMDLVDYDTYCSAGNTPTYRVDLLLKADTYWYTSGTLVSLNVKQYSYRCPSNGPRRASGNTEVDFTIVHDDNGITRHVYRSDSRFNDWNHTFYPFEWIGLCYYSIDVDVETHWQNGNIDAEIEL